jgi:hypothetical protein
MSDNLRFNYILWLQGLLDTTGDKYHDHYDPDRKVVGLDMYASLDGPLVLKITV